jgi:hypothetical protein
MRSAGLACLCALLGCEEGTPRAQLGPVAPSSSAATDALWALAPAGARGGLVASPRAVGVAEDTFAMVRAFLDATPDLAPLKQQLDEALLRTGGSTKLADWGLARDRGAALFLLNDGMVAILPVANRNKFLEKVNGTPGPDGDTIETTICKTIKDVYACATSATLLETLGKGDLKSHFATAKARGDIELTAIELPFTETPTGVVAAAIQMGRGSFAIRGAVGNPPPELTARLGPPVKPRTDTLRSAGFGVIDIRPFLAGIPDVPVVGDVTFAQLVGAIAGPLTINVPAGEATFDLELPLNETAQVKQVVERCTEFAPFAELGATLVQGVCRIKLPDTAIDLEVWVEGKSLRIGKRDTKVAGKYVPMSPIGAELAKGEWSIAFWGRGTLFGPSQQPPTPPAGELSPDAAVAIRLTTLVDEAGVAARRDGDLVRFVIVTRTAFSNPEPILGKVLAITADDLVKARAAERATPIARVAPTSPFGQDFAAGQSGMIIPTSLLGMAANVVLPRFLAAMRGPQQPETPPETPPEMPVEAPESP